MARSHSYQALQCKAVVFNYSVLKKVSLIFTTFQTEMLVSAHYCNSTHHQGQLSHQILSIQHHCVNYQYHDLEH